MRWERQRNEELAARALPGLVRTVHSPDFAGVTFHEVHARSVLNKVPAASRVPFRWTVNPYRGCSHACTYCFARGTHTYLDFDAGTDFDTQVVVKVNAPEVLAAQVRRRSWAREHVAMGTNTDPYQRAEGKYRLMPGIIRALADSGTPLSILTKGTVLARDLSLLRDVGGDVPVGLGVSIALLDRELQRSLEPGTPSPQARLELVRKARDAGLPCDVFLAPILPGLTDSDEALDGLLGQVAEAGASSVTAIPLHCVPVPANGSRAGSPSTTRSSSTATAACTAGAATPIRSTGADCGSGWRRWPAPTASSTRRARCGVPGTAHRTGVRTVRKRARPRACRTRTPAARGADRGPSS